MSLRHQIRRSRPFLIATVAAMLAAPAWSQTTVVIKEGSPQTTVVVKDAPPQTAVVVRQGPSEAECSARAERAAMDTVGVAGGAVRGGVGGAAVGAIVGDNRRSVGRGAAIGAVVGGTVGAVRRNDVYRRVYDDCMSGR